MILLLSQLREVLALALAANLVAIVVAAAAVRPRP